MDTATALTLEYLDILTSPFWHERLDHLDPTVRHDGQAWHDPRIPGGARGFMDPDSRSDTVALTTLTAAAGHLGLTLDTHELHSIPWIAQLDNGVRGFRLPSVSWPHGAPTALADGLVPADYLSAAVSAGLRDVRLIRVAWSSGVPSEYAAASS